MSRRLSVALAFSTIIHVSVVAMVDRWLSDEAKPHNTSTPLLVHIEAYATAGDLTHDNSLVPKVESEPSIPEETRRASIASEQPTETLQELQMATAARFEPLFDRNAAQADAAPVGPSNGTVLVTSAPEAEWLVPETTELSSTQANMLDEKLREWAEELHEIPDLASGMTWNHDGQEYLARFTQLPAADEMGIQRVVVEISTDEDGRRLSSEVMMKRLAFSNFAQFVNRWDSNVEIHDDELDGRFHSNTGINLLYDRKAKPLFHSKVTTASRGVKYLDARARRVHDDIFLGGLETGVRPIRLPKHYVPFPDDSEIRGEQVHRFTEDTRITFRADGRYGWKSLDSDEYGVSDLSASTTYLVADKKVDLHVRGTVNGKVLVYSPERIVIEGDLVYARHPEDVPDADDFLGLVSDKYVDIAGPKVTGPGDLAIHAAIYAKRRFSVRRFNARHNALLYLFGSLSVGSLSATEPRFATKIRFDRRLEELRPPGFPLTNRYEVEAWDEAWTVAPAD